MKYMSHCYFVCIIFSYNMIYIHTYHIVNLYVLSYDMICIHTYHTVKLYVLYLYGLIHSIHYE